MAAALGVSAQTVSTLGIEGKIIFVNGRIGMGSPKAGRVYWEKDTTFVDSAMYCLNSPIEPYFTDVQHKLLSSAAEREFRGYEYAQEHLSEIVRGCAPYTPLRFVTHSMGAAFGEGMARCLLDSGYVVDLMVHFEPYQAGDIETVGTAEGILTIDYQMGDDFVIRLGHSRSIRRQIKQGEYRISGADIQIWRPCSDAPLKKKHRYPINHSSTWNENWWQAAFDSLFNFRKYNKTLSN